MPKILKAGAAGGKGKKVKLFFSLNLNFNIEMVKNQIQGKVK